MAPDFFALLPATEALLLIEAQMLFGVGFKIGAATDVLLVQEDLGHGLTGLPALLARSSLVMPSAWIST